MARHRKVRTQEEVQLPEPEDQGPLIGERTAGGEPGRVYYYSPPLTGNIIKVDAKNEEVVTITVIQDDWAVASIDMPRAYLTHMRDSITMWLEP